MKGTNTWSYAPYKPLLTDVGEVYICRVAPDKNVIRLEWLKSGDVYSVYYRKRGEGEFICYTNTKDVFCDIEGLDTDADYEFYVSSGDKKSRIRLAHTGECVGTVVNYLHPEDEAYAFSGRYLCSPSLVRHPDGYLLASMDVYAGGYPQNLTIIYRSDDDGKSWYYVSELMPSFWGKMFIHRGELYMLSVSTEYGDLLIGKSVDGGKTFSAPVTLLRGSNGKNGNDGVHKNPQNIVRYNGRIYETLEWGTWSNTDFAHAAMVMSCDENDDLLDPQSWSFTEPVKFAHFVPELSDMPMNPQMIEGTLAVSPDGKLYNHMRFGMGGHSIVYKVNTDDPDAPLEFSRLMKFPANLSKFMIKFDEITGKYFSVATIGYLDSNKYWYRDYLVLMSSADLVDWKIEKDIFDYRGVDGKHIGFQYVDFEIDGDDIIFLCRTSFNGAHDFHDSNYSTFHRIKNFRQ